MAVCSLRSASSCGRPCCIRTRVKPFAASKLSRVKSPVMTPSSTGKDDPDLGSCRNMIKKAGAQIRRALRFEQIVEDAELGTVLGAARDLLGAIDRQPAIRRLAISGRGEARRDAKLLGM